MSEQKNNEPIRKLSAEEIKRLVRFFELLLESDMKLHPEKYKSTNGNTERANALPTHQGQEEDKTST